MIILTFSLVISFQLSCPTCKQYTTSSSIQRENSRLKRELEQIKKQNKSFQKEIQHQRMMLLAAREELESSYKLNIYPHPIAESTPLASPKGGNLEVFESVQEESILSYDQTFPPYFS